MRSAGCCSARPRSRSPMRWRIRRPTGHCRPAAPPAPAAGLPVPGAPGAVALVTHRGMTVAHEWAGSALLYRAPTHRLPESQRVPVDGDTILDLASLTKVVTAVAVLVQAQAGVLALDDPVARYVPEFGQPGPGGHLAALRAEVTIRQLLTHTPACRRHCAAGAAAHPTGAAARVLLRPCIRAAASPRRPRRRPPRAGRPRRRWSAGETGAGGRVPPELQGVGQALPGARGEVGRQRVN